MTEPSTYEAYLTEMVKLILLEAGEQAQDRDEVPKDSKEWNFREGVRMGMLSVIGTLRSQADPYGVDPKKIGLGDFNFERAVVSHAQGQPSPYRRRSRPM